MSIELLLGHAALGGLFILSSLWVLVEGLNAGPANVTRIRAAAVLAAALMWAVMVLGGWYYIVYYPAEKALILKGPWPFAHKFVMETKEHLLLLAWILATYLPFVAFDKVEEKGAARTVLCWVAALSALTGLAADAAGAVIVLGAKLTVLPK